MSHIAQGGVAMRRAGLVALGLAIACIGVGGLAARASANLVVNGGFETGNLFGWTTNPLPNGEPFPWAAVKTSDMGPTHAASGKWFASTGCFGSGCLDPVNGAWLTQTLNTVPGTVYTLTFAYDPWIGSPTELQVQWAGSTVFDLSTNDAADPGWLGERVPGLLATSTTTTLTFLGEQSVGFNGLDNVGVNVTPEPPSAALFGVVLVGAAGVQLLRRGRRYGQAGIRQ